MVGKTIATAVGGVGAAFTSALCCVGPLLAVTLGVSGAGLSACFEPLRPSLLIATAAPSTITFDPLFPKVMSIRYR